MAADPIELRPRNTGEILDDAWRLFRTDGVALLLLSGLFQVPAFCALLWLLAHPLAATYSERLLLPLLTAALLALTGVGSGACQELLRRRAENQRMVLSSCLAAALRRGLGHITARAVGLVGILLGLPLLVMPGFTLWTAAATVHTALAYSKTGSLSQVRLGREVRFNPARSAVVVLTRIPIFAFALVNLVILVQAAVWGAGNLGGFNVALLGVEFSWHNWVFLVAGGLFCWMVLTPYFEASNFLLHLDTRVREEGLDLHYRVERVFPLAPGRTAGQEAKRLGASAVILALLLIMPGQADAEAPRDTVRTVRTQVGRIRDEVKAADPYPGSGRWVGRLGELTRQLEELGASRFRWVRKELDNFGQRGQPGAVEILTDLEQRLQVVEESLTPSSEPAGPGRDEVKGLLRPRDEKGKPAQKQPVKPRETEKKPEKPADKDQNDNGDKNGVSVRRGDGMIGPGGGGGISPLFWPIVGGLFLAVLVVALVLWFRNRERPAPKVPGAPAPAQAAPPPPAPHEQPPAALFRQAEELARAGRFKDAMRSLYHAVLSLLHRQHMLRYETTRTNGEYIRQVRLAPAAPPELHDLFARLTSLFDFLWYGDQNCASTDYSSCRELAEKIRHGVDSA
jgi:Domain of unknown function (DUF4129)